jgi:hypothetical protein
MLKDSKLSDIFRAQVVHTTFHILNKVILISNNDKTPYELWKGISSNVKHFRLFGRKCYIKRKDGRLAKFDSQVDKGILVGYSSKRKSYKCFSPRLNRIVEIMNVTIDETNAWKGKEGRKDSEEKDNVEDIKEEVEEEEQPEEEQEKDEQQIPPKTPIQRVQKIHPP